MLITPPLTVRQVDAMTSHGLCVKIQVSVLPGQAKSVKSQTPSGPDRRRYDLQQTKEIINISVINNRQHSCPTLNNVIYTNLIVHQGTECQIIFFFFVLFEGIRLQALFTSLL